MKTFILLISAKNVCFIIKRWAIIDQFSCFSYGLRSEFLKNSDFIWKITTEYSILYGKVHKWCPILGGHFFKNSVGFSSKMQLTSAIFLCSAVSVSLYQAIWLHAICTFFIFWCNSKLCIQSNVDTQMNLKSCFV